MGENISAYRNALSEIARIASALTDVTESDANDASGDEEPMTNGQGDSDVGCRIKALPARTQEQAAEVAVRINPVNAPLYEMLSDNPLVDSPLSLTLSTSKYWGPAARRLTVSFMESTPSDLRARIVSHLNAWAVRTSISFVQTSGVGDVRISRGPGGYYSYLGTDITLIPKNRQTMNLQNFTMNTSDSEFRRVVRHEAGHTLGFPHEHMRKELVSRIDPQKAYAYFLATQGWNKQMVDQQVLTPLNASSIFGTPADQDSIMCYQLPGQITFDGLPIRGGKDINRTDYRFAGLVYPKASSAPESAPIQSEDDWEPADDVPVPA
ncbi:MAG TPA: M12 family metallopeptidase [Acidimicrobiales bacterium]|nr:M12 family metallopeptidase [Acidimicrobiales bacterium]